MTVWIVLLLAALLVFAVMRTRRKLKQGGGCCGEHEAAETKAVVSDRRKAHYPYEAVLDIGGMTCENCARKVENALNAQDGVWASVSISTHQAKLRLQSPPDEEKLREAVRRAGYVVLRCEKTK